MTIDFHRPWQSRLDIGGFQPFSTVDWPGQIVAVVFLRGCPWRCTYCHNPHLQARTGPAPIAWAEVEAALQARRGWLDGVVFSGGEPMADGALREAIEHVRALGFRVGLHTGGAYPERLAAILPLLDWVGLDFKTSPADYPRLTGVPGSGDKACYSAHMLAQSDLAHEFRLTYHSELIPRSELLRAADTAKALGCQHFVLQEYRPVAALADTAHSGVATELLEDLSQRFARFTWRPAE